MGHYSIFPYRSPKTNLANAIRKADQLSHRLRRACGKLVLTPIREKRLFALLGLNQHVDELTLADAQARKEALQILFDVAEQHIPQLIPDGTPLYHVTLCDDIGLTTDRDPIIRLSQFRRKVDKAIRALGLSGFAIIEIQVLFDYPSNGRHTLMVNAHVLGWGHMSRRKFRAAKKKVNTSRSWSNRFGAKPIKTRRLKNGLEDALQIICYQTKAPLGGKRFVPRPGHPGEYRFQTTMTGFTDEVALRLIEGLSQISIFDAVFCIGDAKHIRKVWKADLVKWHRQRSEMGKGPIKDFDRAKLWKRIRRANGQTIYKPFQIV
jgi:hypothetical protein